MNCDMPCLCGFEGRRFAGFCRASPRLLDQNLTAAAPRPLFSPSSGRTRASTAGLERTGTLPSAECPLRASNRPQQPHNDRARVPVVPELGGVIWRGGIGLPDLRLGCPHRSLLRSAKEEGGAEQPAGRAKLAADRGNAGAPGSPGRFDDDFVADFRSDQRFPERGVGGDTANARDLDVHPLAVLSFDGDPRPD